jgi:Domain of Unknown Function (DUF1080)
VLRAEGSAVGWLAAAKQYVDFELELDYCLPPKGNGGICLRAWISGHPRGNDFTEVQLQDDSAYPNVKPTQRTGAIYNEVAPKLPLDPAAQLWHKINVRAVGPRIQVTMNGVRVVDADINRSEKSGRIGLQMSHAPAEFKNLRIHVLGP